VSLLFQSLIPSKGYFASGWITGIIVFAIAFLALALTEETFGKELNYIEA
jgi:putative MFS transporter